MKLLIADDSNVIRERLNRMLSSLNIEKYESADVKETLQKINSIYPNVLLLDIHFPDGNGIEVLQQIVNNPVKPIVIILTNYSSPRYKLECMAAGADYFFDKSKEFLKVKKVINQLIKNNMFN